MRADRPGMDEALWLVDRRTIGQRYHGADPWGRHQAPAHRVAADHIQQHLVQNGELLAHDPTDAEQRSAIAASPGNPATSSRTRASYLKPLTTPTFKPKL